MYVLAAFLASFVAGLGAYFNIGTTCQHRIATSVLFLITGVQMINAILDVLEGYILMGFVKSRNIVACRHRYCHRHGLHVLCIGNLVYRI